MQFLGITLDILYKFWLYGILFALVLTAIIFIHEMGHYLMARFFRVRIELFSIGFGREIWGKTDKYGTRWKISLYPFGGYVRLYGEEKTADLIAELPQDMNFAFYRRPAWQKILIALAGPTANIIFCFILLSSVYLTLGRPTPLPKIVALEANSPAHLAGLKIGDLITHVDDVPVIWTQEIRRLVADKTGETLKVDVIRDEKQMSFNVTIRQLTEKNAYGFDTHRGYLGPYWLGHGINIKYITQVTGTNTRDNTVLAKKLLSENDNKDIVIVFGKDEDNRILIRPKLSLNPQWAIPGDKNYDILVLGQSNKEFMRRAGLVKALSESAALTWDGFNETLGVIFQFLTGQKKPTQELGGVVRISEMTGQMAGEGIFTFLSFVALLSLSIGALNLLPLPFLDGGHIMFHGIEGVRKKPLSLKAKGYVYGFGLIFIFGTIFLINVSDLIRIGREFFK